MSRVSLTFLWETPARAIPVFSVFIPFFGCPRRCVFCSQHDQTGQQASPLDEILAHAAADLHARRAQGNGFSDIGKNLGYVLAMLPDVLVGLFTGKTKSLNMDNSLLPLASIVAGMFVKNPILKMLLMGMGGANLLNKAGHEVLGRKQQEGIAPTVSPAASRIQYRQYPDEPLNPRISNPMLQGRCLVANIDHVPCTIQLPDSVIGAHQSGALPLNTLANAILAKNDQMRQMAAMQYEEQARESVVRPRGIQ